MTKRGGLLRRTRQQVEASEKANAPPSRNVVAAPTPMGRRTPALDSNDLHQKLRAKLAELKNKGPFPELLKPTLARKPAEVVAAVAEVPSADVDGLLGGMDRRRGDSDQSDSGESGELLTHRQDDAEGDDEEEDDEDGSTEYEEEKYDIDDCEPGEVTENGPAPEVHAFASAARPTPVPPPPNRGPRLMLDLEDDVVDYPPKGRGTVLAKKDSRIKETTVLKGAAKKKPVSIDVPSSQDTEQGQEDDADGEEEAKGAGGFRSRARTHLQDMKRIWNRSFPEYTKFDWKMKPGLNGKSAYKTVEERLIAHREKPKEVAMGGAPFYASVRLSHPTADSPLNTLPDVKKMKPPPRAIISDALGDLSKHPPDRTQIMLLSAPGCLQGVTKSEFADVLKAVFLMQPENSKEAADAFVAVAGLIERTDAHKKWEPMFRPFKPCFDAGFAAAMFWQKKRGGVSEQKFLEQHQKTLEIAFNVQKLHAIIHLAHKKADMGHRRKKAAEIHSVCKNSRRGKQIFGEIENGLAESELTEKWENHLRLFDAKKMSTVLIQGVRKRTTGEVLKINKEHLKNSNESRAITAEFCDFRVTVGAANVHEEIELRIAAKIKTLLDYHKKLRPIWKMNKVFGEAPASEIDPNICPKELPEVQIYDAARDAANEALEAQVTESGEDFDTFVQEHKGLGGSDKSFRWEIGLYRGLAGTIGEKILMDLMRTGLPGVEKRISYEKSRKTLERIQKTELHRFLSAKAQAILANTIQNVIHMESAISPQLTELDEHKVFYEIKTLLGNFCRARDMQSGEYVTRAKVLISMVDEMRSKLADKSLDIDWMKPFNLWGFTLPLNLRREVEAIVDDLYDAETVTAGPKTKPPPAIGKRKTPCRAENMETPSAGKRRQRQTPAKKDLISLKRNMFGGPDMQKKKKDQ